MFSFFVLIISLIGSVSLMSISEMKSNSSSILPQTDGRIVGGEAISISHHPYQVSIQSGSSHICGGCLVGPDVIVTAAHCLQNPDNLRVRLGSSYHNRGGVIVPVAKILTHPRYNSQTMDSDVGVIRLAFPVRLSASIRTIGLAFNTPTASTHAIATGWGVLSEKTNRLSSSLQKVTVEIITNSKCSSFPFNYKSSQITNTMICAYSPQKDACQGDSGGPLVANGQLVGVVSWGYGCARKTYPGVYANVADLKGWIDFATKNI